MAATRFTRDRHSYGRVNIDVDKVRRGRYTIVYAQLSVFRCKRTDVEDVVVPHSGYTITHEVWYDASERRWLHKTRKAGAAAVVAGHVASAGGGGAGSLVHKL
jgi:hypothetical protein